jgi:hypothetical protein
VRMRRELPTAKSTPLHKTKRERDMFSYDYLSKSPLGVSCDEFDHIRPPASGHQLA